MTEHAQTQSPYQPESPKPSQGMALRLFAISFLCFAVMVLLVIFVSYSLYKRTFDEYIGHSTIQSNQQALMLIDGDDIEHYAKTMKLDTHYVRMSDALSRFRNTTGAKYFYIMADVGIPNKYTYIYDHTFKKHYGRHALGQSLEKADFPGSEDLLTADKNYVATYQYSNLENYGPVYYSYSPIRNSRGDVVAFIGTEMDASLLGTQVQNYQNWLFLILGISLVIFALIQVGSVRRILTIPIVTLTENVSRLSNGNLKLKFPTFLKKRRSELLPLIRSFEEVSANVASVIEDINKVLLSAQSGRLNARIINVDYPGAYGKIALTANHALEIFSEHLSRLPEAIAFFSMNRSLVYANDPMKAFLALHRLDAEDSQLLLHILSAKQPEKLEEETLALVQLEVNRARTERVLCLTTENGDAYYYSLALHFEFEKAPFDNESPKAVCAMLVLTDITTLMRSRNEAEQANRAKSDFLSQMSHEIRTPMNAIIGMTQIARRSNDSEKMRLCLNQIESSSSHLLGLINDILDMSKIEAQKLELSDVVFSMDDNLDFVMDMIRSKTNDHAVAFTLEKNNIVHDHIIADSLRLNQTLINLLSNAFKFSNKQGAVTLTVTETESDDEYAFFLFSVSDQGIGMTEEESARLFKPFVQADARINRKYGGTGLGLAISKFIVEKMGGNIWVESKKGEGSTFFFTIKVKIASPDEALPASSAAALDSEKPDFSAVRALVVDDLEINRVILMELLSETGIQLEQAANGQEAVNMFAASGEGYYDLIFMDMQMPEMDGCTATKAIRAMHQRPDSQNVIIVAMTANVFKQDIDLALDSGMNGHLGKPIDYPSTIALMRRFLLPEEEGAEEEEDEDEDGDV